MAYDLRKMLGIDDSEERRRVAAPSGPGGVPGATTMPGPAQLPMGAPDARQGGAGWVNLQRYLGVNQDQGAAMANSLAGGVAKAGSALGASPAFGVAPENVQQAQKVGQDAKNLVDFTGRQELLRKQGQGSDYSAGMGRWDSFLADAAGHDTLQKTSDQFGGLANAFAMERPAVRPDPVDARYSLPTAPMAEPRGKQYLDDFKRKRRQEGPYGRQEF